MNELLTRLNSPPLMWAYALSTVVLSAARAAAEAWPVVSRILKRADREEDDQEDAADED